MDRTEIFTHLTLRPKIVVRGGDRKRVERAIQSAQKYSLVANSVKSELAVEPEIVILGQTSDLAVGFKPTAKSEV